MAISNKERVGRGLDVLRGALRPIVEQELRALVGDNWVDNLPADVAAGVRVENGEVQLDTQACLKAIIAGWDGVFSKRFPREVKNLAFDARDIRNKHAHDEPFGVDDAFAALHEIQELLEAVGAPPAQSEEVEKLKMDLLRTKFEEQARREQRKATAAPVEGAALGGLKPWREVIAPHDDVARGTYQQAEFAADLWQVYQGSGGAEYRDPAEFFRRTYLTAGLSELLVNALKRLSGRGGDPVVELQINFGGGKSHSMLSLYHLFSGVKATDLPGIEGILTESGVVQPPAVRRAVLVGNSLTPGSPTRKDDGTVVNTLWGELAWQLGGREAFELVRAADENATNPGADLDKVFALCGPSLILIDEWVAYARQLFGREKMLPAGSFDTQFTFAQTLCEAARRAPNVLVLVSIPASISEQGDTGGQAALDSLKQAVGRSNLVWRPATTDESFEIVRRRLFGPVLDARHRDAVVKAFTEMYRTNPQEFPSEVRDADYEKRMVAAYPIHPELFERLYNDWSTLEKFQRTRGVLRLMAAAIHALWKGEDRSLLILPAMVPISDPTVQPELTRYLPDRWSAVIDKDVDGVHSEPLKLDGENVNYGRFSACRRVARSVFLGSAPTLRAAAQGIEDKRVKLGCAQPGETVATFGDALRKLSDRTTYLYVAGNRYRYDTQASVNKLATELAERDDIRLKANGEIVNRLRKNARSRADFAGVHVAPTSSQEVPDDRSLRLVILGPQHPHKLNNPDSPAAQEAMDLLRFHGTTQRVNRNMVVFMAPDQNRVAELDQQVRLFLAWSQIVEQANELDLTASSKSQAQTKVAQFDTAVEQKIAEVYTLIMAPAHPEGGGSPDAFAEWLDYRVTASGAADNALAAKAAKKLKAEQALQPEYGGNVLKHDIDRVPLWEGTDGNHVKVSALEDYYAQYLYLPRLTGIGVLHAAVREAVSALSDGLGYADGYDEATGRYTNLRVSSLLLPSLPLSGYLVKHDVAVAQIEAERTASAKEAEVGDTSPIGMPTASNGSLVRERGPSSPSPAAGNAGQPSLLGDEATAPAKPTRYYGSIKIDPQQLSTSAGKVSQEVLRHLLATFGTNVTVTLEIHAENVDGFPDKVVQTVSENARVLKFDDNSAFEAE